MLFPAFSLPLGEILQPSRATFFKEVKPEAIPSWLMAFHPQNITIPPLIAKADPLHSVFSEDGGRVNSFLITVSIQTSQLY